MLAVLEGSCGRTFDLATLLSRSMLTGSLDHTRRPIRGRHAVLACGFSYVRALCVRAVAPPGMRSLGASCGVSLSACKLSIIALCCTLRTHWLSTCLVCHLCAVPVSSRTRPQKLRDVSGERRVLSRSLHRVCFSSKPIPTSSICINSSTLGWFDLH